MLRHSSDETRKYARYSDLIDYVHSRARGESVSEITVESVEVDGSTITAEVSYSRSLRRFFTGETFYVDYDTDVSEVPESVLTIPVLAHVCPVAWATGASVSAPVVDATFRDALADVNRVLAGMYPEFVRETPFHTHEAVDATDDTRNFDRTGLLFSGGIDSLTTYIRHRDEQPYLVSVQGWTVGDDQTEAWDSLTDELVAFADEQGVSNCFVRSNMHDFIDTPMLQAHFKRYLVGSWYSGVGHGIGLLGLCAPLAFAKGIGRIYMASTHSGGFDYPWGSHPLIDNKVRWANTTASHNGYELTRQGKIGVITEFVDETDTELHVHVCNTDVGSNCGRCEKCSRTALGFVLQGRDPEAFGIPFADEQFDHIRERLSSGEWIIDEDVRYMWIDLQRSLPGGAADCPYPGAEPFAEWLEAVDIDEAFVDRLEPPRRAQLVQAVVRHTPYALYSRLYPVYDSVKDAGLADTLTKRTQSR